WDWGRVPSKLLILRPGFVFARFKSGFRKFGTYEVKETSVLEHFHHLSRILLNTIQRKQRARRENISPISTESKDERCFNSWLIE
uniref:Uncharacterized protein n=1 Tax=Romanomermis culicivorax TaxID=13658 RepID=A0A915HU50_ROMCU